LPPPGLRPVAAELLAPAGVPLGVASAGLTTALVRTSAVAPAAFPDLPVLRARGRPRPGPAPGRAVGRGPVGIRL
ncbi:MAG: hypothetical protein QM650_15770, partial [Microlunatus sp.]